MKRLAPLLITAFAGFILIIGYFLPLLGGLPELVAVWFDILAAIAFILGGANLMKVHLKKMSDRAAGWGFSGVVILSFLTMLFVGLGKVASPPAAKQEFYGEILVPFAADSWPEEFEVATEKDIVNENEDYKVPAAVQEKELPLSVQRQARIENDKLYFRGWMTGKQKGELIALHTSLAWKAQIEALFAKAQPLGNLKKEDVDKLNDDEKKLHAALKSALTYHPDHDAIAIKGAMPFVTREDKSVLDGKDILLKLSSDSGWQAAVNKLAEISKKEFTVQFNKPPKEIVRRVGEMGFGDGPGYQEWKVLYGPLDENIETRGDTLFRNARVDADEDYIKMTVLGVMTPSQKKVLSSPSDLFPPPTPHLDTARRTFFREVGELNESQKKLADKMLDGIWQPKVLIAALNTAGKPKEVEKSFTDLYREKAKLDKDKSEKELELKKKMGEAVELTDGQKRSIVSFAGLSSEMDLNRLKIRLKERGPFPDRMAGALGTFFSQLPSKAEFYKKMGVALLKKGPLSSDQRTFFFSEYREQYRWQRQIAGEFLRVQRGFDGELGAKYPWSGNYRAQGNPFWWMYEYLFKPLTATMFAMLAFYVASAAFRAFRAKNLEAILLLGTAFIILLGRTFAGVFLTGWVPDEVSAFRIEEMTMYIMQIFNTAGSRAIMIGIALGIASTSLKVLLGIDRSYLGSGD